MAKEITCDVLIVGGGPGGYPAAIRCGQLGLDTVLVDADRLGGTCLIRGCIPSKAIIHAADQFSRMREAASHGLSFGVSLEAAPKLDYGQLKSWKDGLVSTLSSGVSGLLKKAGVRTVSGWARFSNAKACHVTTSDDEFIIRPKNVVLATGSVETEIPSLPFDGERILSSRHVLDLETLPKSMGIIGAGYIGLELGIALSNLGSDVTFFEASDSILPGYDAELVSPVLASLKKRNIDLLLNTKAMGADRTETGITLHVQSADGTKVSHEFEKLLVAVGRKPLTENWGLETMGVDMNGLFVKADDLCRTSMSGVYAIGDVAGHPLLAHKATAQGEMVAEIIAGKKRRFSPVAIPAVCFTDPEIVSVGLSPDEARKSGHEIIIGKFPFAASGRAMAMDEADKRGFVRIIARETDHVILGIQAVGAHIAELSGEFVLALEMGAVLEDLALTIHAHPTLSEAGAEAAMFALGHPIHIAGPVKR